MVKQEAKEVGKEGLEKLAKEESERLAKEAIEKQYDEIAKKGHGVQRHGTEVTERQLDARVIEGKDPITGTTNDGVTGKNHNYGKDATKFTSKESLVKAENFIKNTQSFKDKLNNARQLNDDIIAVKDVKLEDIYGKDYKKELFGKTRQGTKNNPAGAIETDFTDGTITAIFKKDVKGSWYLDTMYPAPKN